MIRAALFDYGGVIGADAHDWGGALLPVTEAAGLSVGEMEGLWHTYAGGLMVGALDLPAFWHAAYLAAATHLAPGSLETTFENALTADPHVLNIAHRLKEHGLRLAVAANESQSGMNAKIKKFGLADLFEKVYCSAAMGVVKPDPVLYSYIIHDLALPPDEILVIDDRAENIASAQGLGLRTIPYQNPAQLRSALERELGVSLFS